MSGQNEPGLPGVSRGGGGDADGVIRCAISEAFRDWMSRCGGSLAVTTYQAGKVALVGYDERPGARQVTLLMRQFDKPLGIGVLGAGPEPRAGAGMRLALATRNEVVLFADAPLLARDYLENQPGRYDALYLPRASFHTGDVNVHDVAYGAGGELWVVNSRFSCLAALSDEYSFVPRWKPPFVSDVVPEDRCHLNGLAMVGGKPGYVTALGQTDDVGGWRANKAAGGVVVHVESGEVVLRGLSMPHSPRWHAGKLWVLNSGAGEVWEVDVNGGTHSVVCALPGYLRGLCFVGAEGIGRARYGVVGMCQIREKHIFGGLPVQQRHPKLLCGLAVIDLAGGKTVGMFEFTAGCQELYDVQFLPGVRRPTVLNLEKEAARQAFTAPDFSYWLRPSAEVKEAPK